MIDENLNGSPFNMGEATLMRINGLLQQISDISTLPKTAPNLKYKYEVIKQLYVSSTPLIPCDEKELKTKLKERIDKAEKLFWIHKNEVTHTSELRFIDGTSNELDEINISIQEALQRGKFFMPPNDNLEEEK